MMRQSPAPHSTAKPVFSSFWLPYLVGLGLILLGIYEAWQILKLKSELTTAAADIKRLKESNALMGLRLFTLKARDPVYASATIIIAWDPHQDCGVVSVENLPAPQPGYGYQLWVLDPTALAPINAGLISLSASSQRFTAEKVNSPAPGFAVSLEPSGGQISSTGTVLFAVSPGE